MSIPPWSIPFWSPDLYAQRRPGLLVRAQLARKVRDYFAQQGFLEVEPAALQISPGNETHLHGFATQLIEGETRHPLYLHTSPEFAMKKLLAAGETRIFALTHVFRNRERSALHAPEFTMLEWYRVGESEEVIMQDCINLLRLTSSLSFRNHKADPYEESEILSVREAFWKYAGVNLWISDREALAAHVAALNMRVTAEDSWSDLFSRLLVEKVEPKLGIGRPTFLNDYPASEAALARLKREGIAERFELYVCGVELANAFGELTNATEQRRRFVDDMALKNKLYGEIYPLDEDFLACLPYMKDTHGAALGFDRLVMLAVGAKSIEDVQWTPVFRP